VEGNGLPEPARIFSKTETPITLVVLVLIGSMVLIRNSYKAFMLAHVFIALGFCIAGLSVLFFCATAECRSGVVDDRGGTGIVHGIHPFNSVFFERLIAAFRFTGNVGFLIYLADSFGYLGSVGVLLSKEIFKVKLNWVQFFSNSVMILSVVGLVISLFSAIYFARKQKQAAKLISNSQLPTSSFDIPCSIFDIHFPSYFFSASFAFSKSSTTPLMQ
jgi:hypothetical protein